MLCANVALFTLSFPSHHTIYVVQNYQFFVPSGVSASESRNLRWAIVELIVPAGIRDRSI